jgi:uncharacterized protein (DUF362 family)
VPFRIRSSDRRKFLKSGLTLAGAALGASFIPKTPESAAAEAAARSRLVIARDAELRSRSGLDGARLAKLLDKAVQTFFQVDDPQAAWRQVAKPAEVIGLKVNCLSGRGNSTHPELVDLISERLREIGVKEIIIWDRLNSDLESARFKISERGPGVRCFGNDTAGYESDLSTFGNVGSLLSRTLTQMCDGVINLPVLKDHGIAGVTIALKSWFGAIHNPNKYHLNAGDPYVADVNMLGPIRRKSRLHIGDAITAQYDGGPSFMPQWTWPYNGLLVATDPVAMDYTGWRIIEKKRAEVGAKPLKDLKREPTYIATAADAQHLLGTNNPSRIEVVEA